MCAWALLRSLCSNTLAEVLIYTKLDCDSTGLSSSYSYLQVIFRLLLTNISKAFFQRNHGTMSDETMGVLSNYLKQYMAGEAKPQPANDQFDTWSPTCQ